MSLASSALVVQALQLLEEQRFHLGFREAIQGGWRDFDRGWRLERGVYELKLDRPDPAGTLRLVEPVTWR